MFGPWFLASRKLKCRPHDGKKKKTSSEFGTITWVSNDLICRICWILLKRSQACRSWQTDHSEWRMGIAAFKLGGDDFCSNVSHITALNTHVPTYFARERLFVILLLISILEEALIHGGKVTKAFSSFVSILFNLKVRGWSYWVRCFANLAWTVPLPCRLVSKIPQLEHSGSPWIISPTNVSITSESLIRLGLGAEGAIPFSQIFALTVLYN